MINFLHHILFPRKSNNFRAKLLHHNILSLFILFFFLSGFLLNFLKTNYPSVLGISADISIDQLLVVTNQKRQENGLAPLTLDSRLISAAASKGNDMLSKNYWAHIAPDGTTPWVFIKQSGYGYVYAGENLARGFSTASDVVNAWMASPTHRDNMLSPKYQNVGFAVLTGNLTGEETVLVVEMFGAVSMAGESNLAQAEQPKTLAQAAVVTTTPQQIGNSPTPIPPSPTLTPTFTPTPVPIQIAGNVFSNNSETKAKPLINGVSFSSDIAKAIIAIFVFILILDLIIIERKKIIRFVGHNLDHALFLILILGLVLVIVKGAII